MNNINNTELNCNSVDANDKLESGMSYKKNKSHSIIQKHLNSTRSNTI